MLPTTRPSRIRLCLNQTKPGAAGFTLVELMLVVVILGVVAALAVPRYTRSFDAMKLSSAAYDVAATVEHAGSVAVLEGRRLRVSVSREGDLCWVSTDEDSPGLGHLRPVTCRMPQGVKIESIDFDDPLLAHRNYIVFRPDGWVDRSSIRVVGKTGGAFMVTVAGGAGHARVVRLEEQK